MKDFKTRVLSADYKKKFRLLIAVGICILVIGGGTSAVLLHTTGTHSLSGPPQMQQDNRPGHNGHGPMDNNDSNRPQMPPQQDNGTQTPDNNQSGPGNKEQDKQDDNDKDDNAIKETSILTTSVQLTELQTEAAQAPDNQPDRNQSFAGPDMGDRSINGYGMNGHGMHHGSFLMQILHSNQVSLPSKIAVLATAVLGFLWMILTWLTIVCYLYRSSTFSRMNPALWTVLGIIGSVFSLIAFFIARSILRIRCAACGSWQDTSQAYCTACGKKLQRVCTACGAAVSQDAAYCASCGAEQTMDDLTDAEESPTLNNITSQEIPETDGNDADEE